MQLTKVSNLRYQKYKFKFGITGHLHKYQLTNIARIIQSKLLDIYENLIIKIVIFSA